MTKKEIKDWLLFALNEQLRNTSNLLILQLRDLDKEDRREGVEKIEAVRSDIGRELNELYDIINDEE